jgi:hypothetical protein
MKIYKDKWSRTKCQKYFFINVWRKAIFGIHFTELGAVMTTVLPVLFKYCYKYCYSDSRKLWAVMERGRFGALKSDSTHHFFRNACTKSGSLRFSQISGCWLILSVYILMSFTFPFVRLLGNVVITLIYCILQWSAHWEIITFALQWWNHKDIH